MALKKPGKFTIWSNAFYVAPFALALYWQLWPTVIFVLAVVLFGSLYHFSNEKRFLWADRFSAIALICSNAVLCYLGSFKAPYFWIAFLFVALSFLYHFVLQNRGQYELNHGMWHLYGALITIFCIFTLVL